MPFDQDVYSSMVEIISHDGSGTMRVTYNNGTVYEYSGVPEEVALDVANAPSVGQAINSMIKGKYKFKRA